MSPPTFSRPTSSAFAGKQTCPLKTMVADTASDDFKKFARDRGYASDSDCLREIVLVAIYGFEHVADLHRARIASLVQQRPGTVPTESA